MRILLLEIILFSTTAFAQWAGNHPAGTNFCEENRGCIVRGQTLSDVSLVGSRPLAPIRLGCDNFLRTSVESEGHFEFRGFTQGQYGSTVSIRQLQHKVPGAAQKEYDKGTSAWCKKDPLAALEHFRKAASVDPEFADAFNGMGTSYAARGELREAAREFQRAVELVPEHSFAIANLSIVLYEMEHYHDAIDMSRRALKFDPGLLKIRYILADSLIHEGGDKTEALDNLVRAAAEIPNAHLEAAKIMAESNHREQAVKQLEAYLKSSPIDDIARQRVGVWLEELRR